MKVGAVIILASIAAFFAWGFAFDLFGHRILLNLQTAGFFGWIAVGMFGVGYVYGGPRGGLRTAGGFAVLAMAAVALGIARGAYR